MNELISVVVPICNIERYISKCVESIINQTYKNLEILLIDDGSADASGKICDEYALKDSRIKVLHKENGGLSDARNAGINNAQGNYICFFDGDDWIEADTLERAVSSIKTSDSNVVVWGYYIDFVDDEDIVKNSTTVCMGEFLCRRGDDKAYEYISSKEVLSAVGYAWNKLYDLNYLKKKNFQFEKGTSLVEDMIFNSSVLSASDKIFFADFLGNHYIQRKRKSLGSCFYSNYYDLKIRACEAREYLLCSFGADNKMARKFMLDNYFAAIKSSCRMVCQSTELSKNEKRLYMDDIMSREHTKNIIDSYSADGKNKLFKLAVKYKQFWVFERLYS